MSLELPRVADYLVISPPHRETVLLPEMDGRTALLFQEINGLCHRQLAELDQQTGLLDIVAELSSDLMARERQKSWMHEPQLVEADLVLSYCDMNRAEALTDLSSTVIYDRQYCWLPHQTAPGSPLSELQLRPLATALQTAQQSGWLGLQTVITMQDQYAQHENGRGPVVMTAGRRLTLRHYHNKLEMYGGFYPVYQDNFHQIELNGDSRHNRHLLCQGIADLITRRKLTWQRELQL